MNKSIKNIKYLLFTVPLLFGIYITAFPMSNNKSYAQSSEGMDSIDILKNYQLLEWLLKCESKGVWAVTGEIGKDSGVGDHTFFQAPGASITESEEPVGHIAAEDTGTRECNSVDGSKDIFKAIGYTFKEWRDKFYKYTDGWEDTGNEPEYDITDGSDKKMVKIWEDKRDYWKAEYEKVKQVQYVALFKAFTKGCGAEEVDESAKSGDNTVEISNYTEVDGKQKGRKYFEVGDESGSIAVGYGLDADGGNDGKMTCATIVSQMNKLAQAWADYKKTDAGKNDNSGIGEDTSTEPNCENRAGITGWIICPIIDGAFAIMRVVEGAIVGQLKFTLDDIGQASDVAKIKEGHNSLLVTANILFAIGILWIVVSQAITGGGGGGFFGAYEAKKMLPKLIAGIIVANLSWELINLALIVTNAIGDSIKSIMLAPFSGASTQPIQFDNGWSDILVGGGAIAAIGLAIYGFFAVSPILIGIVILVITAIAFTIIRKAMIIVLAVFAPIMLALSPFMPNMFKRYYKLLLNTILFYIVTMVSIAGCTIVAYITINSAPAGDTLAGSLTKLIGVGFYFAWILPVVSFAKNNFDVVGKVGGSLQSAGNNAGKKFGHDRLQGNRFAIRRKLMKGARTKSKENKQLEKVVGNATEGGKFINRLRKVPLRGEDENGKRKTLGGSIQKARTGYYGFRQAGLNKEDRHEFVENLEDQAEHMMMEKGARKLSVRSAGTANLNAQLKDAEGNIGNIIINGVAHTAKSRNEMLAHVMDGKNVEFEDAAGKRKELDGSKDIDLVYAAGQRIAEQGGVAELIQRQQGYSEGKYINDDTREASLKSLQLAIGKAAPTAAAQAGGVLGIVPRKIQYGSGNTVEKVSRWKGQEMVGAVESLYGGEAGAIFGNDQEGKDELEASRKALRRSLEDMQKPGNERFMNQQLIDKYNNEAERLGYEVIPLASTSGATAAEPARPDPGTYRDDDNNTRQSGGPGSGGVLLG